MDPSFSPHPEAPALVIGAASIDFLGRVHGDLSFGTSNPAQISEAFGGVARNVAENLARLGQPVHLITAIGDDLVGEMLLEATAQAGVDVEHILRVEEKPTGSYLAVLGSQGELKLALDDMRVVQAITPAYLRERAKLFDAASLLFVDANLPKETLRTAFSMARQARIPVVADATSRGLARRLQPHLAHIALTTPNVGEAEALCDSPIDADSTEDVISAAKCLVSLGVKVAIITRGERGLCYATSDTSGQIPAIRTRIVGPTGVGDAMTAAVIYALLNDIPIDEALQLGVAAASLTLRQLGAVVQDLTLQRLYDEL